MVHIELDAVIPDVFDATGVCDIYNVDDIAYNVYTGKLIALHQEGEGMLSEINPLNSQIENIIFDLNVYDLEGLGFNYLGELFGTLGEIGGPINAFLYIDLYGGDADFINSIDPTDQYTDFEAFDCFTTYNDLALLLEVESQEQINNINTVTFQLTIFNQGNFPNTNISLTNYIPEGLILDDSNWMDTGDGNASYNFDGVLKPGEDHTITVTYLVKPGFEKQTLTNTAEISSSYLPNTMDLLSSYYPADFRGNPTPLPDWDSQPNNENNEINVVDNDLKGGGPNALQNQDEDDHDIALIQVQPVALTVNPELCGSADAGSALVEIIFSEASPFTYEWKDANGSVIHQGSTNDTIYQISNLTSGLYTVTITDAFNKKSTFEVVVPSLSELDGNDNCNNPCPEYLVVPEGEMYGNFKAREIIEIKGEVKKSQTALFDICE